MRLSVPQKYYGPRSLLVFLISTHVILVCSLDMFVPALPSMQRELGISAAELNLTIFVYLVCAAIGTLVSGPVSDKRGRKPLLLIFFSLFVLSSFLCVIAPNLPILVLGRAGQAFSYGVSMTIHTAIVKDSYEGEDLNLAMTLVESLIIIGPMVAPFLGTFFLSVGSWRTIFVFLGIAALVALFPALFLTETLSQEAMESKRDQKSFNALVQSVRELLKDKRFSMMALFMGTTGMPYFAFMSVVSYIILDYFALPYIGYNFIYMAFCLVTTIAPFVYMMLQKRLTVASILRICLVLSAISAVMMALFGKFSPVIFFFAFVPYTLTEGIVRPLAYVELLDQPKHRIGAASSFSNFSYSVMSSIATVIATLPWTNFIDAVWIILAVCTVAMTVFYLIWHKAWLAAQKAKHGE
ncbi:MAG: MFS transporter [Eggerthellaceae bacterium]|jgi:DHA1 family bicyclomycin/chloramphenicol resistance-like MFS transporter